MRNYRFEIRETTIDGKVVRAGDWVGFKSDIEQSGKIISIHDGGMMGITLMLENENGFDGEYIGGDTETAVNAEDCWL